VTTGRRGAALLLVVTVIGLLAFLTAEFQRRSHLEAVLATNMMQSLQAQALARSGLAAAIAMLKEDASGSTGGPKTDSRNDVWAGPGGESPNVVPVGDYVISVLIEDATGKFPVNSLIDAQGKAIPAKVDAFERLLAQLNLTDADPAALADALTDWIDDDSSNDRFEYNARYTVPNKPMEHLSELSRIEGFDKISPEEMKKLTRYLDTRTNPQINANTATVPVLMVLHPNFRYDDAVKLHDELTAAPDTNGALVNKYVPSPPLFPIVYASDRFKVEISTDVMGVLRRAECVVNRAGAQGRIAVEGWTQY